MGEAICATMHFGCLHTSPACNTPSASCSSLHTRTQLQRRAYWLLEADGNLDLVLVHYLHIMKPPQHASNDIITSAVLSEHSRSRGTTPSAALPQSRASPDRASGSGSPLNLPSPCHAAAPDDRSFFDRHQQQQQQQQQQHGVCALSQDPSLHEHLPPLQPKQPQQPQQLQPPGHSCGASSSSASPMVLDLQQPCQSARPDPYMPLLPSMSLDSFFMAVDEQQAQPLSFLPSGGSTGLDPLASLDELIAGHPMEGSLPLSGADWQVCTPRHNKF